MADISHAQLHQITSPKLAVDRQVEQRKIPTAARNLQAHANCPNLFELKWGFLAYELTLVPRLASSGCQSNDFHGRLLLLGSRQFALALKGP
jgi:hypothetical protein